MAQRRVSATADRTLTYSILRRELERRAVRSMLKEGPGGPLVFVWALGAAAFLVPLGLPFLILPLTVAAIGIGWLMLRDYARDQAMVARLIPAIVRSLCPPPDVSDAALQGRLTQGQHLFVEIALKVMETPGGDRDPGRERLVTQTSEMLLMQHESARQAQEFARVLEVVGDAPARPATGSRISRVRELPGLLEANTAALRREAEQASALTGEVVEQMQTLLLQLTQLGVRAIDLVRAAEFAREAREALEHIQAEVSTRQEVADRVIADLVEPAQTSWVSAKQIEKGR